MRAANETRTRDPNLGKVVLYQLSYCRRYWKAVRTGLEPVTPCVTGMYSNQAELTHRFNVSKKCGW